ncbi:hypothetical protein Taro_027631 [Colocasia esculenta]|uniref:Uncharacterized protein n=1 Tax=Colocasia esculenta TaxID=4460 RepID=A0A843VKP3_COLES|nr:hypothetical protein [Colocasia esculenta]
MYQAIRVSCAGPFPVDKETFHLHREELEHLRYMARPDYRKHTIDKKDPIHIRARQHSTLQIPAGEPSAISECFKAWWPGQTLFFLLEFIPFYRRLSGGGHPTGVFFRIPPESDPTGDAPHRVRHLFLSVFFFSPSLPPLFFWFGVDGGEPTGKWGPRWAPVGVPPGARPQWGSHRACGPGGASTGRAWPRFLSSVFNCPKYVALKSVEAYNSTERSGDLHIGCHVVGDVETQEHEKIEEQVPINFSSLQYSPQFSESLGIPSSHSAVTRHCKPPPPMLCADGRCRPSFEASTENAAGRPAASGCPSFNCKRCRQRRSDPVRLGTLCGSGEDPAPTRMISFQQLRCTSMVTTLLYALVVLSILSLLTHDLSCRSFVTADFERSPLIRPLSTPSSPLPTPLSPSMPESHYGPPDSLESPPESGSVAPPLSQSVPERASPLLCSSCIVPQFLKR